MPHHHTQRKAGALAAAIALATAIACLAPAAASASTEAATLYSATWTGSAGLQANYNTSANGGAQWTLNATFPLDGSVPLSSNPTYGVWVPTGSGPAFSADLGSNSPSYYLGDMPGSSLSQSGATSEDPGPTQVPWSCGPEQIYDAVTPDLLENYSGSAVSLQLAFNGQLTPAEDMGSGSEITCNPLGPAGDGNGGEFEINTPNGVSPTTQTTAIQFGFSGIGSSAATQRLTGTNQGSIASDLSTTMSCINDPGTSTCTSNWTQANVTLTLNKVCAGTVTIEAGQEVSATCGSSTGGSGSTKPAKAKLSKAKISSKEHKASFSFSATRATSYKCALIRPAKKGHKSSKAKFSSCKSPKHYSGLKKGKYTFKVEGVSSAGVGTALSHAFKIA